MAPGQRRPGHANRKPPETGTEIEDAEIVALALVGDAANLRRWAMRKNKGDKMKLKAITKGSLRMALAGLEDLQEKLVELTDSVRAAQDSGDVPEDTGAKLDELWTLLGAVTDVLADQPPADGEGDGDGDGEGSGDGDGTGDGDLNLSKELPATLAAIQDTLKNIGERMDAQEADQNDLMKALAGESDDDGDGEGDGKDNNDGDSADKDNT